MKGVHLRLYTYENRRVHGLPVHEWLLARARDLGVAGGSAFKACAGFGRHGKIREQGFFELAGEVPVLVEFIIPESQADALLRLVAAEHLDLFYARIPAEFSQVDQSG
jgi:PII-like signaling protein